jgi:hypothetical protein
MSELGSSGSIVSGYGLDDRAIEVPFPAEAKDFSSNLLCPDRLWGPPSLLSNGYRGSFPRGYRVAGAWRWPLISIQCRGLEWVGSISPLPPCACICVYADDVSAPFSCRLLLIIFNIQIRHNVHLNASLWSVYITLRTLNLEQIISYV